MSLDGHSLSDRCEPRVGLALIVTRRRGPMYQMGLPEPLLWHRGPVHSTGL